MFNKRNTREVATSYMLVLQRTIIFCLIIFSKIFFYFLCNFSFDEPMLYNTFDHNIAIHARLRIDSH